MIKEALMLINLMVVPNVTLGQYGYFIAKDIREVTNSRLVITSNCRTKEENRRVGGVINSMHLECKALDIRSYNLKKDVVRQLKRLTETGRYDVIVEEDHIHIELHRNALTMYETGRFSKLVR